LGTGLNQTGNELIRHCIKLIFEKEAAHFNVTKYQREDWKNNSFLLPFFKYFFYFLFIAERSDTLHLG